MRNGIDSNQSSGHRTSTSNATGQAITSTMTQSRRITRSLKAEFVSCGWKVDSLGQFDGSKPFSKIRSMFTSLDVNCSSRLLLSSVR